MHGNCDEGWADVNISFALVYFLKCFESNFPVILVFCGFWIGLILNFGSKYYSIATYAYLFA